MHCYKVLYNVHMITLLNLNHLRLNQIANKIAHGLMFMDGGIKDELGIGYTEKIRTLSIFFEAYLKVACEKKCLYTTSVKEEGYLVLIKPEQHFTKADWLKIYWFMGLRINWRIMKQFLQIQSYQPGIKAVFDTSTVCEIGYIHVEKAYQGRGLFKHMLRFASDYAKKHELDLVTCVDARQKAQIYQLRGFELIQTQKINDRLTYFNLQHAS